MVKSAKKKSVLNLLTGADYRCEEVKDMAKQPKNNSNEIPANNFAAHPDFHNDKNDTEFGSDFGMQQERQKLIDGPKKRLKK